MSIALALCSCRSKGELPASVESVEPTVDIAPARSTGKVAVSSPRVFVYKLKDEADYDRVPVMLNASGSAIVSYPAPSDLRTGDGYCLPTRLADGYLLDNRGIGPNVAFLDYTYAQYAALPATPTVGELMQHIVSRKPLAWGDYCGRRADYSDIVAELNAKIKNGEIGLPTPPEL